MRVSEEPVCIYLFRQNPAFSSLHLRSQVQFLRPLKRLSQTSVFPIAFRHDNWLLRSLVSPSLLDKIMNHLLVLILLYRHIYCIYLFRQNPAFSSLHLRSQVQFVRPLKRLSQTKRPRTSVYPYCISVRTDYWLLRPLILPSLIDKLWTIYSYIIMLYSTHLL